MKLLLRAVGSIAIIAAISPSLSAQWPRYVPAGVPKAPDGKPDLTAAAPRTADGKPDFSGNWIRGDGQLGPAGGGTFAGPAPVFSIGPPVTTFRDVGANFKEGLPLQPWAAELVKARRAANSQDNPDAHCLPMGLMQFHNHGQPDAAKLTERFRRPNYGTLEIDVTIDDPKAYTKPWTVRVNQRILLDSELMEFICIENQKFESYLKGQK